MKQKFIRDTGVKQVLAKKKIFINKIIAFFKKIRIKKSIFKLTPIKKVVLSVIIFTLALFLLRGQLFAAFVNGRPIFRFNIAMIAEKQTGSTILENLIEKNLILKEARNQNINITKEIIESEISKLEDILKEENVTLEQALEISNQDMDSLKEQIKIQKIIEEILGTKISISDEEIKEYFNTNKEYYGAASKLEDLQEQIKEELFRQKLTTEYTNWIAELKEKAKIIYLVNY